MKIAILIATYNGDRFIASQLDSVLNQIPVPGYSMDIYIRDDGSTDKTVSILEEYAATRNNIHLVSDTASHRGCKDSFLYLARHTEADYYFFCDQDDVWHKDKVIKSMARLRQYPADIPAMVHTDLEVVDENLNPIHPSFFRMTKRWPHLSDNPGYACAYPLITGCTASFNRCARNMLIRAKADFCLHDRLLGLVVLANKGAVGVIDEPTIKYRQHSSNVLGARYETSIIEKLTHITSSIKNNYRFYLDCKRITGISGHYFIFNKIRYAALRVLKK